MSYELIETVQGLSLSNTLNPKERPIRVDFTEKSLAYRRERVLHEGLIQAVKIKNQPNLRVLDTTTGLGTDAFLLACAGYEVVCLERNATLFALLEDGYKRAKQDPNLDVILNRMTRLNEDSLHYLERSNETFDVIYCDPMFPDKKKSAAVKKEMKALQEIVETDDSLLPLLSLAKQKAAHKVVLKRPRLAPKIESPSFTLPFTSCRFDVYMTNLKPHSKISPDGESV